MSGLTYETLIQVFQELEAKDPLLRHDVKHDWVCVVHPALVRHIEEAAKDIVPPHVHTLSGIMGRRTWVISDAPQDRIEYMPEALMRWRYREHFRREAEFLAESVKDDQ